MKIGFHSNQLSLRGTEIALYDYAFYNEKLLGNESVIITRHPDNWTISDRTAIKKFEDRFLVYYYKNDAELQEIIKDTKLDVFYAQKAGFYDGIVSNSCKTVVHTVFQHEEPHGEVYAYISEWLSDLYGKRHPFVPYMIDMPEVDGDLREELGIPTDAVVYGRYGGLETFDLPFVHDTVKKVAMENPNIYFVFMYTNKFSDGISNIIYLDGTYDLTRKVKFINTCDAMLHARINGESFGLAIAEFSIKNKPVLTYHYARDNAHFVMLGDKAVIYDETSLERLLLSKWDKTKDWNAYRAYTPEAVMAKFKEVFL